MGLWLADFFFPSDYYAYKFWHVFWDYLKFSVHLLEKDLHMPAIHALCNNMIVILHCIPVTDSNIVVTQVALEWWKTVRTNKLLLHE